MLIHYMGYEQLPLLHPSPRTNHWLQWIWGNHSGWLSCCVLRRKEPSVLRILNRYQFRAKNQSALFYSKSLEQNY